MGNIGCLAPVCLDPCRRAGRSYIKNFRRKRYTLAATRRLGGTPHSVQCRPVTPPPLSPFPFFPEAPPHASSEEDED
eukprot:scaffold637_cov118-Isochrysis_galbana.AAC.3